MADTSARFSLRGIGPAVVMLYLADLGGHEIEPGRVAGPGWQACVAAAEPVYVGSFQLGVTEIEFAGEPAVLAAVRPAFEKKVLRAGG